MAKNIAGKMRPNSNPYEVWGNSPLLPDWTWYVLKKHQSDDEKPGARWFCNVHTPIVPSGEMGDVYVSDIKINALAVRLCKGCLNPLNEIEALNALSKYNHGYICNNCRSNEVVFGNFISKAHG